MTYMKFLAALRKTKRNWRVTKDGEFRSNACCPITACDKKRQSADNSGEVATRLSINDTLHNQIQAASDNTVNELRNMYEDKKERRQLVDMRRAIANACGLGNRKGL